MANQSMAFRWVATDLVLLVDFLDTLDDADFEIFLRSLATRNVGPTGVRLLVYSAGGGPNAAQRARFDRQLRGKPVRIAVICTSAFTRVIIKGFHLLGFLQVAPFAPDQEEAAFRHLSLKAPEIALVRTELVKLRGAPDQTAVGV
jgi:hypothetical protein